MYRMKALFDNNKSWVAHVREADPSFFDRLADRQEPNFLFIGCSDSRVPESIITGTNPGEMFVHRNIANQVYATDLNLLSVLQYAVEVLDVPHVIVCGHSNCGGVKAAMGDANNGLVDNWLARVREIHHAHRHDPVEPDEAVFRLVCLNVVQQVANLSTIPLIRSAWEKGRRPTLHGLVYDIHNGLLQPLVTAIDGVDKAAILTDQSRVIEAAKAGNPYFTPPRSTAAPGDRA